MNLNIHQMEMQTLKNVASALKSLETKMDYLTVETDDIEEVNLPLVRTKESQLHHYPIELTYKGVEFILTPNSLERGNIALHFQKKGMAEFVIVTSHISKEGTVPQFEKEWQALLEQVGDKLNLPIPTTYFFKEWFACQAMFNLVPVKKDITENLVYQTITKKIAPEKLESLLKENKKTNQSVRIEKGVEDKQGRELGVSFFELLGGMAYVVVEPEEAYCYYEQDNALERYRELVNRKTKEKLEENIQNYLKKNEMLPE